MTNAIIFCNGSGNKFETNMHIPFRITFLVVMTAFVPMWIHCERSKSKVCYGTNNGFSRTYDPYYNYRYQRNDYENCTHVIGNLEINGISKSQNSSFNLDFLSQIEVVTGYVLLVDIDIDVIPLTSLAHVRGDSSLKIGALGQFTFVVVYTNAREIQLPNLKDVSGTVFLFHTSACNFPSINWHVIADDIIHMDVKSPSGCGQCSVACLSDDGVRRCWGQGPTLCQRVDWKRRLDCTPFCATGPCFREGMLGCCHPTCAVGCSGPLDTDCEMCLHYKMGDRCVNECPADTFALGPDCLALK